MQRALRLLIVGIPPRSVDMRTGHALVRTNPRGPTPPKRSWVRLNKGPKRSQRMENIQGKPLKTCRHCFSTGSGNCWFNQRHMTMKRWLNHHHRGVSTRYLDHYMRLVDEIGIQA